MTGETGDTTEEVEDLDSDLESEDEIMAEDDDVRRNRLALLHKLRELFLGIADFSLAAQ